MKTLRLILLFFEYYPIYLSVFVTLIPIGILVAKYTKLEVGFRLLLIYLICKFVLDWAMIYTAATGQNNILLHNLHVPLRYVLLSSMMYQFLESKKLKQTIKWMIPIFLVLSVGEIYVSYQPGNSDQEHFWVRYIGILECILMLLWVLLYFYELLKSLKVVNLLASARFVTVVAWMFFFASRVFFAPFLYYYARMHGRLDLGALELIPDYMDLLTILILAVAVGLITSQNND